MPGMLTTAVVCTQLLTATSPCPIPTVSISTAWQPMASITCAASRVARPIPPAWPRAAMDRMNTPGSCFVTLHPDPVAQQGASGIGARWIDRHHPHPQTAPPQATDHARHQSGFSRTGGAGDSDQKRITDARIDGLRAFRPARVAVFKQTDQPRPGELVALEDFFDLGFHTA